MDRLEGSHIFDAADEAGVMGESTWGEVYQNLEDVRLKGLSSLAISVFFLILMLVLFYFGAFLWGAFSLVIATYYYRNYYGIYGNYRNLYGRRTVLIPNLKIE